MQQHIKIVAILNIIYGALIALVGLTILLVFGGLASVVGISGDSDAAAGAGVLGAIGVGVAALFVVLAAPSIAGGLGLLKYRPWARILTIVLAALHLLSIPLGTALGIYTLWALLKPESEALFRPRGASQTA